MIINDNQKLDDLQIPLVDLPRQAGVSQRYDFTVDLPEDLKVYDVVVDCGEPVQVVAYLTCVSEGVLVDVNTQVKAFSHCYRCLDDVDDVFDVSVQELYYYPGMRSKAIEEGDDLADEMYEVENDTVDLGTLLRDCIVLDLPMRMLCDEDCEGLCPECAVPYAQLEEDHYHEVIENEQGKR